MIENKFIHLANQLRRASVFIALRIVKFRDKYTVRKLKRQMQKSDWMLEQSKRLNCMSMELATHSNSEFDEMQRKIKTQYQYLRSLNLN